MRIGKEPKNRARLELVFDIGMYWRVFYGTARLVLGFTLLKLIGESTTEIFRTVMRHELVEDPHDIVTSIVSHLLSHHGFSVTYFLAAYFIFWGILDVFLSICMLRHQLWAFPVSIWLIAGFVLYELYRFTHTHSFVLLFIIAVDVFVIWIIQREQRMLRARIERAT